MSTGDIVTYLNSDDLYLELTLAIVVRKLSKSQKKWCY
jgi:hypothetical protein